MSRFMLFPKSRRMMSCRRVGETLQAYLDGEVDDLRARRIARHLEDCRRCGMELDVYTEIKASLRRRGSEHDGGPAGRSHREALERLRSFGDQLAAGPHPDIHPDTGEEAPGG